MKELEKLRKDIDRIDSEILRLLNERANAAIEIGKIKKEEKMAAHVPQRERQVYERLEKENQGPFPNEAIRVVFREIMSASLSLEQPLKVAYLGPKATFTYLACMKQFGVFANYIPVNSIKEVFTEVERGLADYGVVPIENSTEGVVNHTLDMFVDSNLKITSEILQEVSHHLLSLTGNLADIKCVYSHPQPIAQCSGWIEKNLANIPVVEVSSTARAAEMCTEDPSAAAIARERAAQLYGLKIIKSHIEDYSSNDIKNLVPYQPGKPIEELEREIGIKGVIKLASNENPLGASRMAIDAIKEYMDKKVHRYPDGGGFYLRRALAKKWGVSMESG